MNKKRAAFFVFFLMMLPFATANAEKFVSKEHNFFIEPSSDWLPLALDYRNVAVSYGKKGTLSTFHITVRDLDGAKTLKDIQWKDLFSPEFDSIDMRTQGETMIGGEKAKFCVYVLKPGAFKAKMEGNLPAKFMNCVLVRGGRLFSITFKDTEEGFSINYPAFMTAVRTLQFRESSKTVDKGLL